MGNIGDERRRIEVLPLSEPGRTEQHPPAPAPTQEPAAPAREPEPSK